MTVIIKYHGMGGATGLDSITFFQIPSLKKKKFFLISPLNFAYFVFILHSRFKNKRSLRSNVDRSTDKMTTVTP